jgi:hypothetical protein
MNIDADLHRIVLEALGSDELPASEIAHQFALAVQREGIAPSRWRGREAQVCARLLSDLAAEGHIDSRRSANGGLLWRAVTAERRAS